VSAGPTGAGKTAKRGKGSKASRQVVNTTIQDAEALALRRTGLGYVEIGNRLGIPKSTAYDSVMRALADAIENRREQAESLRQLEVERLDEMLAAIYSLAIGVKADGTRTRPNPALFDRVLRLMERRARLLGLDAPAKVSIIKPEDLDAMTDEELAAVAAGNIPTG